MGSNWIDGTHTQDVETYIFADRREDVNVDMWWYWCVACNKATPSCCTEPCTTCWCLKRLVLTELPKKIRWEKKKTKSFTTFRLCNQGCRCWTGYATNKKLGQSYFKEIHKIRIFAVSTMVKCDPGWLHGMLKLTPVLLQGKIKVSLGQSFRTTRNYWSALKIWARFFSKHTIKPCKRNLCQNKIAEILRVCYLFISLTFSLF